jgi:hypothetical protein
MPKSGSDFVFIWRFKLPRALPPAEDPVILDDDDGATFLQYLSPMCNRDYTSKQRTEEIESIMEYVAVQTEQPTMDYFKAGTGLIVKGNPFDINRRPNGVTAADALLPFSYVKAYEDAEETADATSTVRVTWYKAIRGDPQTQWHPVYCETGIRRVLTTPVKRGDILLARVKLNGASKLNAGTIKVLCYFYLIKLTI